MWHEINGLYKDIGVWKMIEGKGYSTEEIVFLRIGAYTGYTIGFIVERV